ncbi:hypothetical protein PQ455_01620 [Sphingomonas naphthae]|uniref:Uncharacterized protein n=1 Tax=Sphingomonas naphthae TaxID=1813468 RepID=A0ABY7TQ30_9SPHN|nr:hypothetical protein [Sphingomonas naphthae]WCT73959.1 hypothetical protein PQ455_01620 [Sphingomonas naphthae]
MAREIIFRQPGDFAAIHAAEAALAEAGFSIGSMQKGSPRGLLLGDISIAKWRNLSHQERRELHGEMFGDRNGPVTVIVSANAPADVLAAFEYVRGAALQRETVDA